MTKRELEDRLKASREHEAQLMETVASLRASVDALTAQVTELNETIRQLKEQTGKNSQNSSKPPSSDGYRKPKPKSLRTPSDQKQGAQDGHKGKYLATSLKPNHVNVHMGDSCEHCPHREECLKASQVVERRTVLDVSVDVDVTEHQLVKVKHCMLDHSAVIGSFPDDINATIQYGPRLQAMVTALTTVGAVSINRTHEILGAVFNIPLSTGTISNMTHRVAERVMPVYERIRDAVGALPVVHFDETGTRVDRKLWWVHNASNEGFTYLTISKKRGVEGMNEGKILPCFKGIAVHDCWAPYWRYESPTHAVCGAHLLRELNGIIENYPNHAWAEHMRDLLLKMKKAKEKALTSGKKELSYYYRHLLDLKYDSIIKQAKDENPLPEQTGKKHGRPKKGKVLALVERLEKYKAGVCLFANNLIVPFDNNQAERDIRMVKVKTKVSGCFRTENGAKDYLSIMSYVGTARKHGHNAYEAILNAINGEPDLIFEWGF